MAKNGAARIAISREHLEMQIFLSAPADDEDAREFLRLKRQQALKHLQTELHEEQVLWQKVDEEFSPGADAEG